MTVINLRKYYPNLYSSDYEIAVPDEIAAALRQLKLDEAAARLRTYRAKAYYSLDRDDQIERDALCKVSNPYEILERRMVVEQLHAAIATLPDKQAKRIYARYFLNMSITEIARAEGVSKASVSESISRALKKLLATLTLLP